MNNPHKPDSARVRNAQTQLDAVLAAAVEKNDLAVARAALALGANANVKIRADLSAFHHCVLLLHGEMAGVLAENGADIHARHVRGATSLQMLWWCRPPLRLRAAWYDMADRLRALGCDSTSFKTPREMTADELTQEPAGAYKGARAMDYALRAHDFATYRRGFAVLGMDKPQVLLAGNAVLQESPLRFIVRGRQLHEILRAELWYGQGHGLRRVWAAAAQERARPQQFQQWRAANSREFSADDYVHVLLQIDRHMLVRRDKKQFKL